MDGLNTKAFAHDYNFHLNLTQSKLLLWSMQIINSRYDYIYGHFHVRVAYGENSELAIGDF